VAGKRRAPEVGPERGPSLEQTAVGKDAISNLDALSQLESPELSVVRDAALPMVDRTLLALELELRGEQLQRWVEILDGSQLPSDRKEVLVDRLYSDERTAGLVHDAVERWFSGDSAAVREQIGDALSAISGDLRAPEILATVTPVEGSVQQRAEAAIGELATHHGSSGAAVVGLCRDLYLALWWEEEEEEEGTFEPAE